MEFNWTGKWPVNRAPRLDSIFLDKKTRYQDIHLKIGKTYEVQVYTHDVDNDTLKYTAEILPDMPDLFKDGGDREVTPFAIECKSIINQTKGIINFTTPEKSGPYRIYVYVHDGHNHAATANVPFWVEK
jgi:hypothetical protein